MELPALKLPQIDLPFDIPVLMHPPVDHFVIAIPVLVLLIEIVNLVVRKKALGVLSFGLLILGMVAAIAAYLTGVTDGKEAFDALSQAGQTELKEHKLLGTYLMLASMIVVLFKLFSAMIQKGLVKAIYLLILIAFVAGILKQGKDGGELVYEYGANVEIVKELDDELFDLKEELDEMKEEANRAKESTKSGAQTLPAPADQKKETGATKEARKSTPVEEQKQKAVNAVKDIAQSTKEKVKEVSNETLSTVKEKANEMKVEVIPSSVPESVKIETH